MGKFELFKRQKPGQRKAYEQALRSEPETLSDDQLNAVLLEVLQISPLTANVARRMLTQIEQHKRILGLTKRPEIARYIAEHPDVAQIIQYGFYTRLINAGLELVAEGTKFIDQPDNHYAAKRITDRYTSPAKLADYIRRYENFPRVMDLLLQESELHVGRWLTRRARTTDVDPENPYTEVVKNGHKLGAMLVIAAKDLAKRERTEADPQDKTLNSLEYMDMLEVLLSVIKQEATTPSPTIAVIEEVEAEQLAKVFFDYTAYPELKIKPDQLQKIPNALRESYRDGLDLYHFMHAITKQIPEALMNEDHPGHRLTCQLVSQLNDFEMDVDLVTAPYSEEMYNYMICVGLIEKDFTGKGSFQEFIYNLYKLTTKSGPNQEWYRSQLEYLISLSRTFPHRVVLHADQIGEVMFDVSRQEQTEFDLAQGVSDLMEASEYTVMEIEVNEAELPIERTSLNGETYSSVMHIHRLENDFFLVNVLITTSEPLQQQHELGFTVQMSRFTYQINIHQGRVTTFVPVADREQIDPEVEATMISHVKHILNMIDVEALKERTQLEKDLAASKKPAAPNQPASQVITHEQRKQTYESQRQNAPTPRESAVPSARGSAQPVQLQHETFDDESNLEAEEAKYVPRELILSRMMADELATNGKKGAKARIMKETATFFQKYNRAAENKPGKGIPYTALSGPNGERIWRFRLSYDDRCVAVEVGDGRALLVFAGDHDDTYQNYKKITEKVNQALEVYYGGMNAE